jgi:hypothetical protein
MQRRSHDNVNVTLLAWFIGLSLANSVIFFDKNLGSFFTA